MSIKNYQKCDRVAAIALTLSVFLGIVAFVPGGFLPGSVLKGYLLVLGVLISLSAWLVGRLLEGSFRLPKTVLLPASGLLFVGMLLSVAFSHTPSLSFLGEGFEPGTFIMIAVFLIAMFLGSALFSTKRRFFGFLSGFLGLYILIALYQVVHLIFPSATAFGAFAGRVSSPVGLWSDFAFLSGAALIGFTLVLEFFKPVRMMKVLSVIGALLALFFVALANVFSVWVLVGVSALVILTYRLVATRFSEHRHFPFMAFILSLVALMFILANNLLGGFLAQQLQSSFVAVNPSLSATVDIAKSSIAEHPVFGVGPNRFLQEWVTYHPATVNSHMLWNVPFNSGSSFVLTVALLGGAVGILVLLLFLASFFYESFRRSFSKSEDTSSELFVFSLFILTLYFVVSIVIFSPGLSVILCAFFFIGLLLASLKSSGRLQERTVHFLKDQRASFFSILLIVFLLMLSAGTIYASTERFASLIYFNKGVRAANMGDLPKADQRFLQAIALSDLPVYQRARVLLAGRTLQDIVSKTTEQTSEDAIKAALQQTISAGNAAALRAVALDSKDPANYLALGDLMRLVASLKVEGAFDSAHEAYERAIAIAPHYPVSYLSLAELYFEAKDNKNARLYIDKALVEKPNYTEAYFLLAQIEIAEGNTSGAIKKLEDAAVVDPNNPNIYFELGVLRYQSSDYKGAVSAFNVAVNLKPDYLNAWYFLALASDRNGARQDALSILEKLHEGLPENEAVKTALDNVRAGRPAQTTASPVVEDTKQADKAKKLPVPSTDRTQ